MKLLPKIKPSTGILLSLLGLIVGTWVGIYYSWFIELFTIAILVIFIQNFGPGEQEELAYAPLLVMFIFGCIIGDVNIASLTSDIVLRF